MTGRIAGGSPLQRNTKSDPVYRGANQTGLRAANERLVLSLIRLHGQLSKGQIADITGLTAQTASVIVRSLEADGLLLRGAPVRGKIGQPSVPMSLRPAGALFVGLHLQEQRSKVAIVDFLGRSHTEWCDPHGRGSFADALSAALDVASSIVTDTGTDKAGRLQGCGIALSTPMLSAVGEPGLDQLAADIGKRLGLPVYIQDEAAAACSAEVVHGAGCGLSDFLFIHIGDTVGGALVQHSRLQFAVSPASPDIGRMLVPANDGRLVRLGEISTPLNTGDLDEDKFNTLISAIACAIQATDAVMMLDAVIIDGVMPSDMRRSLVKRVRGQLQDFDPSHKWLPVREGTSQQMPSAVGAACLPLLSRFSVEAKKGVLPT